MRIEEKRRPIISHKEVGGLIDTGLKLASTSYQEKKCWLGCASKKYFFKIYLNFIDSFASMPSNHLLPLLI